MTTDTKYNGWTNYETWLCALWLDNSEGDQARWNEAAQECFDNAEKNDTFTRKENAAFALADQIKESFEEYASEWMRDQTSFFADLINAGLSEINWHEIAEHYIDEVDEEN